jgi:AcrR family transcriptional regulator
MKLITTKGYTNVTIDEICEQSGVTKGAFYHHFKSKKSILLSFLDSDARIIDNLPKIMQKESSIEQLKEITLTFAEMVQYKGIDIIKQSFLHNLEAKYDEEFSTFYSQFYNRPIQEVELAIIKNGQENGEIRDDVSPEDIQRFIISSFNGFVLDWCYHNGNYNFREKINKVWSQFFLFSSPPS